MRCNQVCVALLKVLERQALGGTGRHDLAVALRQGAKRSQSIAAILIHKRVLDGHSIARSVKGFNVKYHIGNQSRVQ